MGVSRKQLKGQFMKIIFSKEAQFKGLKRKFQKLFPNVSTAYEALKEDNYKELSKQLQRTEAKIVLDCICKRINIENPKIPIITVHDSIIITRKYHNQVHRIIQEELILEIGHQPVLKTTYY
jgi:hypothetical protein